MRKGKRVWRMGQPQSSSSSEEAEDAAVKFGVRS